MEARLISSVDGLGSPVLHLLVGGRRSAGRVRTVHVHTSMCSTVPKYCSSALVPNHEKRTNPKKKSTKKNWLIVIITIG